VGMLRILLDRGAKADKRVLEEAVQRGDTDV
jgi:hypothetical protein